MKSGETHHEALLFVVFLCLSSPEKWRAESPVRPAPAPQTETAPAEPSLLQRFVGDQYLAAQCDLLARGRVVHNAEGARRATRLGVELDEALEALDVADAQTGHRRLAADHATAAAAAAAPQHHVHRLARLVRHDRVARVGLVVRLARMQPEDGALRRALACAHHAARRAQAEYLKLVRAGRVQHAPLANRWTLDERLAVTLTRERLLLRLVDALSGVELAASGRANASASADCRRAGAGASCRWSRRLDWATTASTTNTTTSATLLHALAHLIDVGQSSNERAHEQHDGYAHFHCSFFLVCVALVLCGSLS